MEKLDPELLRTIITGPAFTSRCAGEFHNLPCEVKTQLCSIPEVAKGFTNSATWNHFRSDPGDTIADIFSFGFILAREYYAVKRLEETVFNTGEEPDRW